MYKIIPIVILSLFLAGAVCADCRRDTLVSQESILLPEVRVVGKVRGKRYHERQRMRESRLRYNVCVAYPYAREAARRIEQIEARLLTVTSREERQEIVKREYNELMKAFKRPLMKLTVTQGRILVRLVYRETQQSSFQHIKEYKGGVNAYFWQSLALLFGNNLKAIYDPEGQDFEIEQIVQEMEGGVP